MTSGLAETGYIVAYIRIYLQKIKKFHQNRQVYPCCILTPFLDLLLKTQMLQLSTLYFDIRYPER